MPLFRFHIRRGLEFVFDPDGLHCADFGAAKREAIRGARSIFSEQVHEGKLWLDESIEVHDEADELVWTVTFATAVEIVRTPPLSRGQPMIYAA